ncbi:unnamed protein product [Adineta steineri]|uniref:J domain-containing protein n=1 Tax=Adineta steineri TaxID=433720 RepID=A0A815IIW4_9BILA|nr:unnamed protein product [Adineta steineri]CAF1368934.1 unnamed protein product [Adineta steineri]
MCLIKYIIIYFIFCFYNLSANDSNFNPYEALGVSRTASDKDIRQAYKKLAKQWHPDKNSQPNANDQFTKINNAYEILSDSKKRQNYDQYGTTSEDNRQGYDPNHFHDPFNAFREHFFHQTSSKARKVIHAHEFLNDILPNSFQKPYLIFGSTNFCFHCRRPLEIFRAMEQQLNDVGIGTAEFNIHEERLSNELGILNIPSLCVISQGRVYHFNDQQISEASIKEFVRKSIPIKRFIQTLETYDDLLELLETSNQTNRVHALLITKQKIPTLKFVLPCLKYSTRIQCALLPSTVLNTNSLPSYFKQISKVSDTILLFKEDINKPDVIIKDNDFTSNNIHDIFQSNQILHLPIITSANVFNLVCQINSMKSCFLIIGNSNLFAQHQSSFLHLSKQLFQKHKSHIAYIDSSSTKQVEFNRILSSYYQTNEKKLLILAVRRWSDDTVEIQNLKIEFNEKSFNEFNTENILKLLIDNRWQNTKKYTLPSILNFDQRNENIFLKLIDQFENVWNYWIERNGILRYLSGYLYTYQFWFITIIILIYIYYSREEPKINSKQSNKIKQIHIHDFDESLLERYMKPGASNVIILLLIADTPNDQCVEDFKQKIRLIKDSRMVFSILYRRQQSSIWLNELSNNIENKQSIRFRSSTVLALYIRRKFFVSYWPIDNDDDNNNSNSNEIVGESSSKLTFSNWIDLLFDGNFRDPNNITKWPIKFS